MIFCIASLPLLCNKVFFQSRLCHHVSVNDIHPDGHPLFTLYLVSILYPKGTDEPLTHATVKYKDLIIGT